VSGVDAVRPVAELVERIDAEYAGAQRETAAQLASALPQPPP
jgi:nitronate monooxygenase